MLRRQVPGAFCQTPSSGLLQFIDLGRAQKLHDTSEANQRSPQILDAQNKHLPLYQQNDLQQTTAVRYAKADTKLFNSPALRNRKQVVGATPLGIDTYKYSPKPLGHLAF